MSGGLLPETVVFLRDLGKRVAPPLFANAVMAAEFEGRARRGHFTILPRTDGLFAVVDERRPIADRTVSIHSSTLLAFVALEALAGQRRP